MSVKRLVPLNAVSLATNPATGRLGDIYYNTVSEELRYFDGTEWAAIAQSASEEAIQDIVGGMVSSNTETDLTVTYDDTTGKLNFAAGANLVTTTSLTNTLTHPTTGYVPIGDLAQSDGVATLGPDGFVPASQLNIDEKIQDTTALMFTSATHSNITVAYDDNTGRLNLTGIPLTQEQVQDFIAPLFAHSLHTNITATYDDTANKVILEGSGGSGSGTGGSLTNSWWLGA
jgi:hypothetical protein